MSLNEWKVLTPEEWACVAEAYAHAHSEAMHERWECMRMLATISVQPHVKNRLTPARLLPFPWDKDRPTNNTETAHTPRLSKEEARERFLQLIGNKPNKSIMPNMPIKHK